MRPGDDLAGAHTDAQPKVSGSGFRQAGGELAQRFLHGYGRQDRPLRIVLVRAPCTEEGQQAVLAALQDLSLKALNRASQPTEHLAHDMGPPLCADKR